MIEVLVLCYSILNGDFIGSEAHILLFLQSCDLISTTT
jgi:hypothetical protein